MVPAATTSSTVLPVETPLVPIAPVLLNAVPAPEGAVPRVPPGDGPVVAEPGRYPTRVRKPMGPYWPGAQGNALTARVEYAEPATYKEAMESDHAEQWQQAMNEEMESLWANKTWVLEELQVMLRPCL